MRALSLLLGSTLVLALAAPASAQDIDVAPGTTQWFGFGFYPRWGQTFTAPTVQRYLESFSFDLGDVTAPISFRAYVYQWIDSGTGALVWDGGTVNLTADDNGVRTFDTGGRELDPGAVYVALLDTEQPTGTYPTETAHVTYSFNRYAGGSLVVGEAGYLEIYDGTSGTEPNGNRHIGVAYDAGFRADFSAGSTVTPEPVSMALLGTGLAGLGALRRRRRRDETA